MLLSNVLKELDQTRNLDLSSQHHQKQIKQTREEMIELLTANTPNGKKISIMLEEIKFEYKVTKINI